MTELNHIFNIKEYMSHTMLSYEFDSLVTNKKKFKIFTYKLLKYADYNTTYLTIVLEPFYAIFCMLAKLCLFNDNMIYIKLISSYLYKDHDKIHRKRNSSGQIFFK